MRWKKRLSFECLKRELKVRRGEKEGRKKPLARTRPQERA